MAKGKKPETNKPDGNKPAEEPPKLDEQPKPPAPAQKPDASEPKLDDEQEACDQLSKLPLGDNGVAVALKRDLRMGDKEYKAGTVIAVVEMHPECSLNYLVDAVRNGHAGAVKE